MEISQQIDKLLNYFGDKISNLSTLSLQKISEQGINPSPFLPKLLAIFFGAFLIYMASKIGKKGAKIIMMIVGILMVISIGYSFF